MKCAKFQTYRMQFENLRINEDDNIVNFFLTIDEVVNTIKGFGKKFEEVVVVQRVSASLPSRRDAKVSP